MEKQEYTDIQKRQILNHMLDYYCPKMGILPEEKPIIYFTKQEYDSSHKNTKGFSKSVYGKIGKKQKLLGKCSWYERKIYVGLDVKYRENWLKQGTLKDLNQTLVHELIHYRCKNMKHGIKFNTMIHDIINEYLILKPKHIKYPQYKLSILNKRKK